MIIDVDKKARTCRILGDESSAGGPVRVERTAMQKAWGVFNEYGTLVDVRIAAETEPPNQPYYVKVITISWKENDK